MSRILFISDLHLAPERPDIIQLFERFLDKQVRQATALYILGDLVEYWLGDDDEARGLASTFDKIRQISDLGVAVFLMHGNRDFLMGKQLAKRLGCTLIDDPHVAQIDHQPVLLMHGDTLCTDDVDYQKLRAFLRNPAWQQDFLSKPLAERIIMARALREKSTEETRNKTVDIMDVNSQAVEQAFVKNNTRLLIHGHTHRPNIHQLVVNNQSVTRIVLGDWYTHGSYLEFSNPDEYRLLAFH
ncbi:MAG: UDP-2,3-diacylglucosamine hydrolase [Pseudomonadota bacterium]|nr:UDP-2,3-diacylglucosamine hydrolase [Pseudomonadota bacterium]